ncbi:MAG: hypothetical protein PWQ12_437 [Clostridiales bacterium]|nr:hypothetical protein [Clostridiales bacterium]
MDLKHIAEVTKANVIAYKEGMNYEVKAAFSSDLMSDVLAYVEGDVLLMTGLINHQVIRTAEMLDLKAILFVRGKRPAEDVIQLAEEKHIVLMCTQYTMFSASGRLFQSGLVGVEIGS